jgi:hypothetical protein
MENEILKNTPTWLPYRSRFIIEVRLAFGNLVAQAELVEAAAVFANLPTLRQAQGSFRVLRRFIKLGRRYNFCRVVKNLPLKAPGLPQKNNIFRGALASWFSGN